MASKEEVIKGLEKVWDAFHHMEHELYADYVYDALEFLKGNCKHGQQQEVDITFDQLITDLCMCRGKSPEIGTMKLCDVSIEERTFAITVKGDEKSLTMTITPEEAEQDDRQVEG